MNFILRVLRSFLFKVAKIKVHKGAHAAFCYLVLQVAAVFVRLPDLFFQLFAALTLFGQLLRQQLTALSGFTQVLQCGRGFHFHGLGDILSQSTKRINKEAAIFFSWVFRQHSYLHHWLSALLTVQLELQLPHPVLLFPHLLPSPPLALFTLSLPV